MRALHDCRNIIQRAWGSTAYGRAIESMRWCRRQKGRSILRFVDVDLCSSIYPSRCNAIYPRSTVKVSNHASRMIIRQCREIYQKIAEAQGDKQTTDVGYRVQHNQTKASEIFRINEVLKLRELFLRHGIGVLRGRVCPILHISLVCLNGFHALAPYVAVLLDELGEKAAWREVAGHVDLDEYLSRAPIAGTNANSRDLQLLRNQGGYLGGYSLQDNGEASGCLYGFGIFHNFEGAEGGLPLDSEASEGILALGCKTDVT